MAKSNMLTRWGSRGSNIVRDGRFTILPWLAIFLCPDQEPDRVYACLYSPTARIDLKFTFSRAWVAREMLRGELITPMLHWLPRGLIFHSRGVSDCQMHRDPLDSEMVEYLDLESEGFLELITREHFVLQDRRGGFNG